MINTNHKKLIQKMKKKGWEKHYLSKTYHILKNSEKNKHSRIKKLDKVLILITLLFIILVDIIILIGVLPLFIFMPHWFSLLVVIMIGLIAGAFIDYLLRHLNLTHKQYITSTLITTTMLLLFFWVIKQVNPILIRLGYIIDINPLLILFFYKISYFLPHTIYKVKK